MTDDFEANPYPVDSSGITLADVDIADAFFERLAAIEAAAVVSVPQNPEGQ